MWPPNETAAHYRTRSSLCAYFISVIQFLAVVVAFLWWRWWWWCRCPSPNFNEQNIIYRCLCAWDFFFLQFSSLLSGVLYSDLHSIQWYRFKLAACVELWVSVNACEYSGCFESLWVLFFFFRMWMLESVSKYFVHFDLYVFFIFSMVFFFFFWLLHIWSLMLPITIYW